jgi:hypothetical protein
VLADVALKGEDSDERSVRRGHARRLVPLPGPSKLPHHGWMRTLVSVVVTVLMTTFLGPAAIASSPAPISALQKAGHD